MISGRRKHGQFWSQKDDLCGQYGEKGRLKELAKAKHAFLAMADIDDFKKKNTITVGIITNDIAIKLLEQLRAQVEAHPPLKESIDLLNVRCY